MRKDYWTATRESIYNISIGNTERASDVGLGINLDQTSRPHALLHL